MTYLSVGDARPKVCSTCCPPSRTPQKSFTEAQSSNIQNHLESCLNWEWHKEQLYAALSDFSGLRTIVNSQNRNKPPAYQKEHT